MAKEFLEYDPWTGIATYTEQQHSDKEVTVYYENDVAPLLEHMKKKRTEGNPDKPIGGMDGGLRHYCNVDNVTAMKLMQKGINIFNPGKGMETFRKLAKEIETNYPHLKATNMKAWRPAGQDAKAPGIIVAK